MVTPCLYRKLTGPRWPSIQERARGRNPTASGYQTMVPLTFWRHLDFPFATCLLQP